MADPPVSSNPTSPISALLQKLGMTREDLMLHTEQMRAHLSQPEEPPSDVPPAPKTRSAGMSRTRSISNVGAQALSPPPPRTPVKSEPLDVAIPTRPMDTMERVIERKSRQGRRERKDSVTLLRDNRRVQAVQNNTPSRCETPQLAPETPHHYKYYSERVIGEASSSQCTLDSFDVNAFPETPSRKEPKSANGFKVPGSRTRLPKTPVNRHLYSHASSSCASTPCSSPSRIVNIVSSPGPMRASLSSEDEDGLEDLPYTLPPGPYSREKPDFSYAALIGQAILSSPEHRLTLQDIYEWITTVYPYYTRGEQTWMNSIRHSLSTMAVFRKVTRGRNEGKSLWAIWDSDIPCFANGGFRKSLCADMVKSKPPPAKSGPKRKVMEETLTKETKRRKKNVLKDEADGSTIPLPSMFTAPILPPFYTPVYPNAQHQPYYQTYVPQPLPAEVIFPPLPAHSAYHRALTMSSQVSRQTSAESISQAHSTAESSSYSRAIPPKAPLSSSSSIPDLTPNCSSSSSPPLSSQPSLSSVEVNQDNETIPKILDTEDEVDRLTAQWLASPSTLDALEVGITLSASVAFEKNTTLGALRTTGRKQQNRKITLVVPPSPTLERQFVKSKVCKKSSSPQLLYPGNSRPSTPPPRPCTPPRKQPSLQISAQRTPISHRGLHMSPSPSLAHYKSNLDPPPAAVFHPQAPLLSGLVPPDDPSLTLPNPEVLRTPSRKRASPGDGSGSRGRFNRSPFPPVTPKRLLFGTHAQESPFRTPSIFDPHDPSALIDEEVLRLGSQNPLQLPDSPMGFFGRRSILYESPGLPSPERLNRYW
ncbi:hypothetical protein PHLCEN_2v11334 [Hermanssonia centrifuga]|uniref:Fork-head domain-containing protein n=1 Tax=Hermanssonia centrifuga TaxID=98765 RepID=A0A2R6NKE5_9APHY|nr:hypothetical protein PHLCEN_2v11334 [Hermanssonia centrifuga]